MKKAKMAAALLAAAAMSLCLAGCVVCHNGGGLSDISYGILMFNPSKNKSSYVPISLAEDET